MTEDGGLLIAREIDRNFGFTKLIANKVKDSRHKSYIVHTIEDMVKQRIYGLIS